MNRCQGCGVVLQSECKEKMGYIPKEKEKEIHVLCERCFRILHYNELKLINLQTKDIISTVNEKGKYAFFLVDLLNINKEVLHTFKKINIPKTLIVSKIDLIPKSFKKEKIASWLKEEYKIEEDILFLSALKSIHIHSLQKKMAEKQVKSAYLLGYTNAGKSTLINCLQENKAITASYVPNTTMDFMKISLEEDNFLIDTPGFQYQNPIYDGKEASFLKRMHPKKLINPITHQLKKGTSLVIENIIRIENKSEKCNITLYMSNALEIKKVYENNNCLKEKTKITKEIKKEEDIVLKELGFMNVKSDCTVNFYLEKPNWIEVRHSFFER